MAESEMYDVAVIGAGPGGYVAAIRAAQLGGRVALIEKERVGGMCLNWGCIPTKALVHQADLFREMRHAADYGIDVDGAVRVNFARMMARKSQVVDTLVGGVEALLRAYKVDVHYGLGSIREPGLVHVEPSTYHPNIPRVQVRARTIIIASGSLPVRAPLEGNDLPGVVNARGLLEITTKPADLVVIGASVVGVEFASIFAALGTRVALLGRRTFLKDAEEQLTRRYRSLLARQGVKIDIGIEFRRIVRTAAGRLRVEYERAGQAQAVEGDVVLASTGHAPVTSDLGAENVGLAMQNGRILVDEHMATNVPGIYAIGDVTGIIMLAHVASHQGIVAAHNAMGRPMTMDYRVVPNCIFTSPEIAGVGLTERQAKEQGLETVVGRFPFNINGRALGMGQTEGQVRMVCAREADGTGGKVLGVHIMGPRASDLIAEAALAMRLGARAEDIAHTIHQHPTLPEAVMEAAMGVREGAIHYQKVGGWSSE
ncbi:MAG: dihydrolipoyl dehydrogenase [Anaerolineae bacterium]